MKKEPTFIEWISNKNILAWFRKIFVWSEEVHPSFWVQRGSVIGLILSFICLIVVRPFWMAPHVAIIIYWVPVVVGLIYGWYKQELLWMKKDQEDEEIKQKREKEVEEAFQAQLKRKDTFQVQLDAELKERKEERRLAREEQEKRLKELETQFYDKE
jgi:sensor histidine kinase YesM